MHLPTIEVCKYHQTRGNRHSDLRAKPTAVPSHLNATQNGKETVHICMAGMDALK